MKHSVDFDTMRIGCITIYDEVCNLFTVAHELNINLEIGIYNADQLKTDPQTKTWDGMGRFAKQLYENSSLWTKLPTSLHIESGLVRILWKKDEARATLREMYEKLGGEKLLQ